MLRAARFGIVMATDVECPRKAERDLNPPQNDELIAGVCWDCPALLREVDERGEVTLYCLVYRNRFRVPDAASQAAEPPRTQADWSRERLEPS